MSRVLLQQDRQGLILAAALLRYPDKTMNALLVEAGLDPGVALSMAAGIHKNLAECVCRMDGLSLQGWQTEHVRVFDLSSDTTPHLAWHMYGDTPDLGRAYAALLELYRDAGFEPQPGELPDSLPVVLEFLAVAPDWAGEVLLDGFAPALRKLTERLTKAGSLYAPLLQAVHELLELDNGEPKSANIPVTASALKECAL